MSVKYGVPAMGYDRVREWAERYLKNYSTYEGPATIRTPDAAHLMATVLKLLDERDQALARVRQLENDAKNAKGSFEVVARETLANIRKLKRYAQHLPDCAVNGSWGPCLCSCGLKDL